MVYALPSRQRPASLTLGDVNRAIEGNTALPPLRRRDLLSAVRSVCRLLNADPCTVPADPQELRQRLEAVSPKLHGSRWANIKSLTLAALRETGITVMAGRSCEPLTPEWADLKAKLKGRDVRYGLCRLISYFSGKGIAPAQVDLAAFERYRLSLEAESFVKAPGEVYRNACRFWNRVRLSVAGWPDLTVEIPRRGNRYALDWGALPETFRADTEAYLTRMGSQDILADDYVRSASPRTVQLRRHQIKILASALVRSGFPADQITGLEILVMPENARKAMRFFLDRAGGKRKSSTHELARLLGTIGRYWVKLAEADQKALDLLAQRLAVAPTGMTDKNRARLRQFDDPANIDALLNLPADIVRQVRKADFGGVRDATRVMRAVAVELLTMAPMRIKNLTGLTIDRHLVRSQAGSASVVHLVIPGEEVKNHEPYELALPPRTVALLDLYIRQYRPRLVSGGCPRLFPGAEGAERKPAAFAAQIGKFILAETGIKMNVHLFRHLAVKLHLEAHPGDVETARRLLGHKSLHTTLRAYSDLQSKSAFQQYDKTITDLRERSNLLPKPRRAAAPEARP